MVTNVTSLTGNGLKDWLIQRATSVFIAAYSLFLFAFIIGHPHLAYPQWQALFANNWFKVASIVALLSLALHTWVGVWTVTTDYLKCTAIRLAVQLAVVVWLSAQVIWGIMIMWGQ